MQEFKSIKWIAHKLFYVYKFLGVITIPLITILFIISTSNLLSSGQVTTTGFDTIWAVIYAICFEMNGLRLVIDGALEKRMNHKAAYIVDFIIGISLVVLGTTTTFIEGLVNAQVMTWEQMKSFVWIVLAVRSLAIIAMIIRECVHYAPLLVDMAANQTPQQTQNVTQVVINQTNQTLNVTPNQTLPPNQTSSVIPNQTTELIEGEVSEPNETKLLQNTEPLAIPEKSSVNKKQTIIDLVQQNPSIKQIEVVRQTGFSKGYVSSVFKELQTT